MPSYFGNILPNSADHTILAVGSLLLWAWVRALLWLARTSFTLWYLHSQLQGTTRNSVKAESNEHYIPVVDNWLCDWIYSNHLVGSSIFGGDCRRRNDLLEQDQN